MLTALFLLGLSGVTAPGSALPVTSPASSPRLTPRSLSAPPSWGAPSVAYVVAASSDDADKEAVKDFKKFYRKLKDPASQVEAVLTLLGNPSPSTVDALLPLLKSKEPDVGRAAARVLASFKVRPPIDRLLERFEKEKKEEIRVGMLIAMREGKYSGLGEVVREGLGDKSWAVRRHTILALSATGDATLAPLLVPLSEDGEPAVRCAATDALAEVGAPETIQVGQALLADEVWQVRSSAIRSLGVVRSKSSVALLIARFDLEEGRLLEDIGLSLDRITGRGLGGRIDRWKSFWEKNGDRFEIPSDAELAKLLEAKKKNQARYVIPGSASFHGIDTPSRSILFVIDVSGSMENLVVDKERFEGGDYPSWERMDIVKTELARTIEGLESYVKFGIVSFATDTKRWKKTLVSANVINKQSALDFIKKLEPLGGNSKVDLANAGLAGAANLGAGKTNTFGALALALGMEDVGLYSKEKYLSDVDTIFFLSDGRPTHGKYIDTKDILARVTEANKIRKVVLHTIAIGNFNKEFMKSLAEWNGGAFVDLGK